MSPAFIRHTETQSEREAALISALQVILDFGFEVFEVVAKETTPACRGRMKKRKDTLQKLDYTGHRSRLQEVKGRVQSFRTQTCFRHASGASAERYRRIELIDYLDKDELCFPINRLHYFSLS